MNGGTEKLGFWIIRSAIIVTLFLGAILCIASYTMRQANATYERVTSGLDPKADSLKNNKEFRKLFDGLKKPFILVASSGCRSCSIDRLNNVAELRSTKRLIIFAEEGRKTLWMAKQDQGTGTWHHKRASLDYDAFSLLNPMWIPRLYEFDSDLRLIRLQAEDESPSQFMSKAP